MIKHFLFIGSGILFFLSYVSFIFEGDKTTALVGIGVAIYNTLLAIWLELTK